MKNPSAALLFVVLSIVASGCYKEDKNDDRSVPDTAYDRGMHANINGNEWRGWLIKHKAWSSPGSMEIQFDGYDSATREKIYISLAGFTGKSIHKLSSQSGDRAYYSLDTGYAGSVPTASYATAGQITVTMLNDTCVQGSFDFSVGGVKVTEGNFNIKLD